MFVVHGILSHCFFFAITTASNLANKANILCKLVLVIDEQNILFLSNTLQLSKPFLEKNPEKGTYNILLRELSWLNSKGHDCHGHFLIFKIFLKRNSFVQIYIKIFKIFSSCSWHIKVDLIGYLLTILKLLLNHFDTRFFCIITYFIFTSAMYVMVAWLQFPYIVENFMFISVSRRI